MIIVIWNGRGRTGNQLFQVAAMLNRSLIGRRICKVIYIGHEKINLNLNFIFRLKISYFLNNIPYIGFELKRCLRILFSYLAKYKLISSFVEIIENNGQYEKLTGKVRFKKGIFPIFCYVDGYFQSYNCEDNAICYSNKYIYLTKGIFDREYANSNIKCAISMRFTDYGTLTQLGFTNFILPVSYFREAITKIIDNYPNVDFMIFSDDVNEAKDYLEIISSYVEINYTLIESSQYDMGLISLCEIQVLSASTFGWWAWKLSNKTRIECIVPKCWLGFKMGFEYPPGIIDPRMTVIMVEN